MKKVDIIASILGLLVSLATYFGTLYLPRFPVPLAGPEFFPRLSAFFLGILSLVLLVQALRKRGPSPGQRIEKSETPKERVFWKMVMAMGASILYFLVLGIFGFLICTFSYFAFLMLLMQTKKKIFKTIIWSLANTVATYLIFSALLKATLPVGWIFR
jgi:hypothetical protein